MGVMGFYRRSIICGGGSKMSVYNYNHVYFNIQ
jgi:hypothetical protein